MDTEDLEFLLRAKILGVGYERTVEGYTLMLVIKGKEIFITSEEPMDIDIREIH